jgi:SSS family solute:Na+ symporter
MFVCGLIIIAIGISDAGGAGSFVSKLTAENPTHLSAYLPADHESYPWHGVILGLGLVLSPAYWVGGQAILQRTLGARTQWDASAGMMFAALAKTFVPVLIVFPGLLAIVMMADIEYPDMALPWVIKNVLPVGVSGLMFVAIIAALQSSIDSSINSTALMITRDIRHVLMKNHNPESDLKIGRLLTLGLLLSAMSIAPYIGILGGIFNFLQLLLSLFQGPMLALLLLGALTKRATATGGIITLVSGVTLAGILTFVVELNLLYVAFFSFCYAVPALWIISGFTQPHSDEHLKTLTYSPWGGR